MTYTASALHHTLEIQSAQQWYDLPPSGQPGASHFGRLLAAMPGLAPLLYTDVWSGPVTVELEFTQTEPVPRVESFDVAVETSVLTHAGRFGLRGMEDPPNLIDEHGVEVPAGWLRMRTYVRGRGIAYDEAVSAAVEHYFVQVWPQPPSPTVDLMTGEQIQPSQATS